MKTIGERVALARKSAGLTRQDLAKACKVTVPAIQQIETGKTKSPVPENVAAIAEATGVALLWLIKGEGQGPTTALEAHASVKFTATAALSTQDDIIQRIPIIEWSAVKLWPEHLTPITHSVPVWRRPGASSNKPYSDTSFAVIVPAKGFPETLKPESVLIVDPQVLPDVGDIILAFFQGDEIPTLFNSYPGKDRSKPQILRLDSRGTPEDWDPSMRLVGTVRYILPP
jgi:transcriptional regulator with XRE-family HTH domain